MLEIFLLVKIIRLINYKYLRVIPSTMMGASGPSKSTIASASSFGFKLFRPMSSSIILKLEINKINFLVFKEKNEK
jgi:hypothetical protein